MAFRLLTPTIEEVLSRLADSVWKKPVWCRISHEHVPDPTELFEPDATCLRCGRVYDDAAAHDHRQHRLVARRGRSRRRSIAMAPPDRRRRIVDGD